MEDFRDPLSSEYATVILTGSTGSIGSYLLDALLDQWHVRKIYCLNRAEDGEAAQSKASGSRGLDNDWIEPRIEFLRADLSRPDLGLEPSKYDEMLERVTHIIHSQWPVNFNWDFSTFEPHIHGVRRLLDFSSASTNHAQLLFLSSAGSVSHLSSSKPVPERPCDVLSPSLNGYSASKLVSELIIEDEVRSTGEGNAAICRVGQVAGPVEKEGGAWNKQEWFPTVITSSKRIGFLPSDLGAMDSICWIPVDILADVVLELAGIIQKPQDLPTGKSANNKKPEYKGHATVYHAVNPHSIRWAELVPTVADALHIPSGRIVPWAEWVDALRSSAQGNEDPEANTGLKLLDYFESLGGVGDAMPTLATELTRRQSETLAALDPVGPEWMKLWLKQWAL
ncbi:male sterility domain-containing protein [Trichoderma austrokoningii]